jgi:hypothetical protein
LIERAGALDERNEMVLLRSGVRNATKRLGGHTKVLVLDLSGGGFSLMAPADA